MRQQSLKLLSLLFVLFALSAATASPMAQADVEEAKPTPPHQRRNRYPDP